MSYREIPMRYRVIRYRQMTRSCLVFLLISSGAFAAGVEMDSSRGQRIFETQGCIQCHAINGKGGHVAPDLGRSLDRSFTPGALASTMWNHAPTMWSTMAKQKVDTNGQRSKLDEQAAADLFAYFYSVRFFDKPGDAARGKRIFHERTCDRCHGLTTSPVAAAPPVSRWVSLSDPMDLTQAMWNHAGAMSAEIAQHKMAWPELSTQDLSDLLVYFRNLPSVPSRHEVFITTAGSKGAELFDSKGCKACHDPTTLLLRTGLGGHTLTDVAAAMWNHSPRMKTPPAQFNDGEMRELVSYLWANQFFSVTGNAERGKKDFTAKHCATCHDNPASGAPNLANQSETMNGSTMVSALWRHGPEMLNQMKAKNIRWPRFDSHQMSDLIAFLNSRRKP